MIHVAAAVICRDDKVLLASRPENKPPAGWEFPGGKIEPGETPAQAIVRELMEELKMSVVPGEVIYTLRKENITLYFIRVCPEPDATAEPQENQQIRWVPAHKNAPPPEGLLANDLEFWDFLAAGLK